VTWQRRNRGNATVGLWSLLDRIATFRNRHFDRQDQQNTMMLKNGYALVFGRLPINDVPGDHLIEDEDEEQEHRLP
jgi:endonuclease YncB( thermonuclease family)